MMRALWSAASGMLAQQNNVDIISNNLSNVNTAGFKRARSEFQDLFYASMRVPGALGVTDEQMQLPLQVGSGVRMTATRRDFSTGIMEETGKPYDMMIEGPGFFVVQTPNGQYYTRDGCFTFSPTGEGDNMGLFTSDGYQLLLREGDAIGSPVVIPEGVKEVSINTQGLITVVQPDGTPGQEIGYIALATFANPSGMEAIGRNLYDESASTGARTIVNENSTERVKVLQGWVEGSNVMAVDEFVRLIVAQRAYEMNSKAIQSADEMLGQANNLRR